MDTFEWLKRAKDEQWVDGNAFGMTTPKERGKITNISFLDICIAFEFENGDGIQVGYDQIDDIRLETRMQPSALRIVDRERNRWFFETVTHEVAKGAVQKWREIYSLN